jgi:hypothetical protein
MNNTHQYEVLSPWADVDPVPLKGLSAPRLQDLKGKRIGLFRNFKAAADQIFSVLGPKLEENFGCQTSSFTNPNMGVAELETDSDRIKRFESWLSNLDAVLLAHGD